MSNLYKRGLVFLVLWMFIHQACAILFVPNAPLIFPTKDTSRAQLLAGYNQNPFPQRSIQGVDFVAFTNVDISPKTMQKSLPGEEQDYIALSNAGINFDFPLLQHWIRGHGSVAYYKINKGQGSVNSITGLTPANAANGNTVTGVIIDDAFITFANFDTSPFFVQFGQIYLPFHFYNRYDITPSLVQILSMSRAPAIHFGVVDLYNFTASVYFAQGSVTRNPMKIQGDFNSGASILFHYLFNEAFYLTAGFQYMYNMLNTNAFRQGGVYDPSTNTSQGVALFPTNVYATRTDGMATQLKVGIHDYFAFFNYVKAFKRTNNLIRLRTVPLNPATAIPGAKPSAWEVGAGAYLTVCEKKVLLKGSYQHSTETAGLFIFNSLPPNEHPLSRVRYIVSATLFFNKDVYATISWGHNFLHKIGQGDNATQGDDAKIRFGFLV